MIKCRHLVSDIAVFVLKRDVKLQPTKCRHPVVCVNCRSQILRCSDPNGDGVPQWPEYTSSEPRYLEFAGAEPSSFAVLDSFRDDYCRLWLDINRQLQDDAAAADAQLGPLAP